MTSSANFNEYFNQIKLIWKKLDNPNRIIPFCTPIILNPKFLIIGTNHSDNFHPNDEDENIRIADLFSNQISTKEHTFLDHHHPFAEGLRDLVSEIQKDYKEFKITNEWLGTNRCAIQTNSSGLGDEILKHPEYVDCQKEMDNLLENFIKLTKPKNVILTGKVACGLYYSENKLKDMKCKKLLFGKESKDTFNLIPIWQLSNLWRYDRYDGESFKEKTVKRLKNAIEDGLCEL